MTPGSRVQFRARLALLTDDARAEFVGVVAPGDQGVYADLQGCNCKHCQEAAPYRAHLIRVGELVCPCEAEHFEPVEVAA